MANSLNENIFGAISTIVDSKIEQLEYDVTEVCKLTSNYRQKEQNYTADLKGSEILVYPKDDTVYKKDDVVLITIPKNNLTEKKYITGLAYQLSPIYETPNEKFIPLKVIYHGVNELLFNRPGDERRISAIGTVDNDQFSNYLKRCDTIYVSLQLKFLTGAENYLTSNKEKSFGLRLELIYDYKEKPVNIYLDSSQFIGNPTYPYLNKQDFCIPNYQQDKQLLRYNIYIYNYVDNISFQIPVKGICVQFGYQLVSQSGIQFVQLDADDLEYNKGQEIAASSTDRVSLIWYNTDENGKFIGFDLSALKGRNINDCFYDEKQYQEYSLKLEQCQEQYQKSIYPYDFTGLELAQGLEELEYSNTEIEDQMGMVWDTFSAAQEDLYDYWFKLSLDPEFMAEHDEDGLEQVIQKLIVDGTITEDEVGTEAAITKAKAEYKNRLEADFENFETEDSDDYRAEVIAMFNSLYSSMDTAKFNIEVFTSILKTEYASKKSTIDNLLQDIRAYQDLPFNELQDKQDELNGKQNAIEGLDSYYNQLETIVQSSTTDSSIVLNSFIVSFQGYEDYLQDIQDYLDAFESTNLGFINNDPTFSEEKKQKRIQTFYNDFNKMKESHKTTFQDIYSNFQSELEQNVTQLKTIVEKSKEKNKLFTTDGLKEYYSTWREQFNSSTTLEELIEEQIVYSPEKAAADLEKDKEKLSFYLYIKDNGITEIDPILREKGWRMLELDTVKVLGFDYLLNEDEQIKSISPVGLKNFIYLDRNYLSEFTTYRAVLYYDRIKCGDATITYQNKQYVIPSDDNPYLEVNYKTDRYIVSKSPLRLNIKALNEDEEYISKLKWAQIDSFVVSELKQVQNRSLATEESQDSNLVSEENLIQAMQAAYLNAWRAMLSSNGNLIEVQLLQDSQAPFKLDYDETQVGEQLDIAVSLKSTAQKTNYYCVLKITLNGSEQIAHLPLPTTTGNKLNWISVDGASILTLGKKGTYSWNKTDESLVLAKPFTFAGDSFTADQGQVEYSMHLYKNNSNTEFLRNSNTDYPITIVQNDKGLVRLQYNPESTLDIMDFYYIVEMKMPEAFDNEIIYYPVLVNKISEEEE